MKDTFDTSVFIITSEMQTVAVDEYDPQDESDGLFVMLTNDALNRDYGDDNSICIYKKWKDLTEKAMTQFPKNVYFQKDSIVSCQWQTTPEDIPGTIRINHHTEPELRDYFSLTSFTVMLRHLNGYRTCRDIISSVIRTKKTTMPEIYIPAVMLAHNSSFRIPEVGQTMFHGYLPSAGQLEYLSYNVGETVRALRVIGGHTSVLTYDDPHILKGWWWSCDVYDTFNSWSLLNGKPDHGHKSNGIHMVMPLFIL